MFSTSRLSSKTRTPLYAFNLHRTMPSCSLKQNKDQISSYKNLFVTMGILGGAGAYIYFSIPQNVLIKGKPSSPSSKSGANRLVYPIELLEDEGEAYGANGRSIPHIYKIKTSDPQNASRENTLEGYYKDSPDARINFLNELVYHRFAEQIMDYHPKIKLVEKTVSNEESTYGLFIESKGRNAPANLFFKEIKKNNTDGLSIENMGCAAAFANLIRSSDPYLKNFVIVFHDNDDQVLKSYSIDFELISDSDSILFIDLSQNPHDAAIRFIRRGGVLDYTTETTFHHRGRVVPDGDSDLGLGKRLYSEKAYDLLIRSVVDDIENGKILTLYQRVAHLSPETINKILDPIDFIFKDHEKEQYRLRLEEIISQTKYQLEKSQEDNRPSIKKCF